MPKTYHITAKAIVNVPDDAVVSSREIQLPNGHIIRPWVTLELDEDEDLTSTQIENLAMYLEHDLCEITPEPS